MSFKYRKTETERGELAAYEVIHEGETIGVVYKAEIRTPVMAEHHNHSVGTDVEVTWRYRGQRYGHNRIRAHAAEDLLDSIR